MLFLVTMDKIILKTIRGAYNDIEDLDSSHLASGLSSEILFSPIVYVSYIWRSQDMISWLNNCKVEHWTLDLSIVELKIFDS